jgi:hypothetical protein
MENEFYVYVYMDPRKNGRYFYEGLDICFLYEPFYVGKGKNKRCYQHLMESNYSRKTFMGNKIKSFLKKKIDPIIVKLYDGILESDAYDRESYLIEKIGKLSSDDGPLVNLSEGGAGVTLKGKDHPNWGKNLKESTRKKISEKLKINNGMKRKEVSDKVRDKNLGREPWNKGIKEERTDVIKKLSEKKIKYRNIKAISKKTGEIIEFNNTNDVMDFVKKTHRMIMIYFERGESKEYFWKFDKLI